VHADTARLAALENGIVALGTDNVLDKDGVALAGVGRDVFALAGEGAVFGTQGLTILTRLVDFPKAAVVVSQPAGAVLGPDTVAGAPQTVKGDPDLHVLRPSATGMVVLAAVAAAGGRGTPG
jgi:hypothetical protein